MASRRARGALLLVPLALTACAAPRPVGAPWQAALGRAHPLTGRVWDVRAARFVDEGALVRALAARRYVLLGEKHGHPDHHRLQAVLVRALVGAARRPSVAFEQFTTEHGPAIARHLAAAPGDAAGLGAAVDWSRSGWPDWALYRPIAEIALAAGLPIVAANLPPRTARAIARGGADARPAGLVARYGLDRAPPAEVGAAMATEIREAHCGHAPERLVAGMIEAQRARDAQLADALLSADGDGAVLIAGAGHVRRDRGVPAYLALAAPGATVASLVFVEVDDARTAPADYGARFGGGLPFDYVWFTPRVDDVDPCERFRPSLERLQR